MFFSYGHRNKKDALTVIFTIGSARVTGSIVSTKRTEDDELTIYYTTESTLAYQDDLDLERFTRSMLSALMEVAMRVQQEGLQAAREQTSHSAKLGYFACVFTAPWYISQTHTVTLKRKQDFVVKESLIQKMLRDEIQTFQDAIKERKDSLAQFSAESAVADAHVLKTALNGYHTKDPLGKTAHTLSLTLYISLMSKTVLTKVQGIVGDVFHTDSVSILSSTLVTYLGIESFFKTPDDYLILETHGEVTDVTIVEERALSESASFPSGTNSAIRHVTRKIKRSPQDILSRIKLMARARVNRESPESQLIEQHLFEYISEWLEQLHTTLERVSGGKPVPQTAFLSIDPQWQTLYMTALKQQSSELITFSDRPFTVASFDDPKIRQLVTLGKQGRFLPLMVLVALMHKKILEE